MVERAHRQLKDALRARLAGVNWSLHLPWVLLALRAAPKDDSGLSSAQLVFGCQPVLPGQLLVAEEDSAAKFADLLSSTSPLPTRKVSYAEAASLPSKALMDATHVYVRRGGTIPPLAQPYVGPYLVAWKSSKCFVILIGDRRETVSVDRLKAHLGSSTVQPALPPSRGRPQRAAAVPVQPLP
jgi:hypothetical protein